MVRFLSQFSLASVFTALIFLAVVNLIHQDLKSEEIVSVAAITFIENTPEENEKVEETPIEKVALIADELPAPSLPILLAPIVPVNMTIPAFKSEDITASLSWKVPILSEYQPIVTSPIVQTIPILKIPPIYPRVARRGKIEGWVKLQFTITTKGRVEGIKVVAAEPAKVFDSAAKIAMSQWQFKPKMKAGSATPQVATQVIRFKLKKS